MLRAAMAPPGGLFGYSQLPQQDDAEQGGGASVEGGSTGLQQTALDEQQQQQQDARHRRCRSLGAAAFYGAAASSSGGWHPGCAVPLDAVADEAAGPCASGSPPHLDGAPAVAAAAAQQQPPAAPRARTHHSAPGCQGGARHQRSASLGLLGGAAHSSSGGPWWGAQLAGSHGLGSSGSLLQLGGWGGALGTLVAESLGARRPSFGVDPVVARPSGSRPVSRAASSAGCLLPACLICLDPLSPEDFESGEAIKQACACKGDVAVRHRRCAVQWSLVKRSTTCDVCRAQITNLPELPPEVAAPRASGGSGAEAFESLALGEPPGLADYLIDAVRVTWVTLVVCALFFDLPLTRAFAIGAVVGAGLTAAAHALVIARRSAAAVRAFGSALRERAWAQGQHHRLQMADSTDGRSWPGGEQPASLGQPLGVLGEGEASAAGGPDPDAGDAAAAAPVGPPRIPSATVLNILDGA